MKILGNVLLQNMTIRMVNTKTDGRISKALDLLDDYDDRTLKKSKAIMCLKNFISKINSVGSRSAFLGS